MARTVAEFRERGIAHDLGSAATRTALGVRVRVAALAETRPLKNPR